MALSETPPVYINADPAQILADCVNYYVTQYQTITGFATSLQPAQIEQLIINMFSYRETLVRNQINNAAILNLPQFSNGAILDALTVLVKCFRIQQTPASCNVEFTLVGGHGDVLLPIGTRVATSDGNFVFETSEAVNALSTDTTINVICICQTPGTAANGYATGTVNNILDPQSFVASALSTNATAGGTDTETDAQLIQRSFFAPASFSVAGATNAYKYFALSADPSIVDVGVTNPVPGTVAIYPLVKGGIATPSGILAAVLAACSALDKRPICDTVNVYSPQQLTYSITVGVVIYANGNSTTIQTDATNNLTDYTDSISSRLNVDVDNSKLIGQVTSLSGVKTATVTITQRLGSGPFYFYSIVPSIAVGSNQYAYCTGVTVTITSQSTENG